MPDNKEVTVKPVRSFVIRPMGDGLTSAFIFETSSGHSGFRIANADISRMVGLIIGEQAKLGTEHAAKTAGGAPPPALPVRGLEVSAGSADGEVVLTADFGGTVLPMTVDRNLLAGALTSFLEIVQKND